MHKLGISSGDAAVQQRVLEEVKRMVESVSEGGEWSPRAFSMDKDKASKAAVNVVFPNAIIVRCLWHAKRAITPMAKKAGLSKQQLHVVLADFDLLAQIPERHAFRSAWKEVSEKWLCSGWDIFLEKFSELFIEGPWSSLWTLWSLEEARLPADVKRNVRTNMLTESQFKRYVVLFLVGPYVYRGHVSIASCTTSRSFI